MRSTRDAADSLSRLACQAVAACHSLTVEEMKS
jgi:hypothetical protein